MKKMILLLAVFTNNSMVPALRQESFGQAPKKVVIEDFTAPTCGYCPKAKTEMEDILATYPDAIGISYHYAGSLHEAGIRVPLTTDFNINGYPTGIVDRTKFPGQTQIPMSTEKWKAKVSSQLSTTAPLNVRINSTYNNNTKALNVTVTASFVANASGDMRINCVLIENDISLSGEPQYNYYSQSYSGGGDPTSPWYTFPHPISYYRHDKVARRNLAGSWATSWGTPGVIPANATSGASYSKTYSYTLPATWNAGKMSIVAFVSYFDSTDVTKRTIINANSCVLGGSTSTTTEVVETENQDRIEVQQNTPNPFRDVTAVRFQLNTTDNVSIKVYDLYGKEVKSLINTKLTPGAHTFYWAGDDNNENAVTGGMYYYTISTSFQSVTKPMIFINR